MKRVAAIRTTPGRNITPAVLMSLWAIVPEWRKGYDWLFCCELSESDPRLQELFAVLASCGVGPLDRKGEWPVGGAFIVRWVHRFSDDEYRHTAYLWLAGFDIAHDAACVGRSLDGAIFVDTKHRSSRRRWLDGRGQLMLRRPFRAEVESQRFVGLGFRETRRGEAVFEGAGLERRRTGMREIPVPPGAEIDELVPTIELPPMLADKIERRDGYDAIVPPCQGPGRVRTPGFDDGCLVYSRKAVESVGPFDWARTWEYALPLDPESRMTVVSQRVYRYLLKQKIEALFIPVSIIDD